MMLGKDMCSVSLYPKHVEVRALSRPFKYFYFTLCKPCLREACLRACFVDAGIAGIGLGFLVLLNLKVHYVGFNRLNTPSFPSMYYNLPWQSGEVHVAYIQVRTFTPPCFFFVLNKNPLFLASNNKR